MRTATGRDWHGVTIGGLGDGPTPPALVADLHAVDQVLVDLMCQPWGTPALCYDGTSAGLTTRSVYVSVPGPCAHARAHITRSAHSPSPSSGLVQQPASTIVTTSSGGAPADVITVIPGIWGPAVYLHTSATDIPAIVVVVSSVTTDDAPVSPMDRQIKLTAGLAPTLELVTITDSCGLGVVVTGVTPDLETL